MTSTGEKTERKENKGMGDILDSRGFGGEHVVRQWSGKASEEVTPE